MNDFKTENLLIELGCEELPPKSLNRLAEAFFDSVCKGLEDAGIAFDRKASKPMHTPRRLAMILAGVADKQPDRTLERRGPALSAAFDGSGAPTRAAEGFASSVGKDVTELETLKTDKGEWLYCRIESPGQNLGELIYPIMQSALNQLPVPKPMRWSDHEFSFVRPVHWLVVLHGETVLEGSLYGQSADRVTWGHRIHSPGPHAISHPEAYESTLENACVLVNPDTRRQRIADSATAAGKAAGGETRITPQLLDEVCNLLEWPVAIACQFEELFLEVPQEALIASMEDHQKFFPVLEAGTGRLTPHFIAMANIDSKKPAAVEKGFERVIRPRLADARFFWEQDNRHALEESCGALDNVVFQQKLGSVGDKSRRVAAISKKIAEHIKENPDPSARAALLAKCDLVSQMVGEFPELQGTMGAYYAAASNEDAKVCVAIREHYSPRFAGDTLPESVHGQILSLADRLDTLVGIFSIGLQPTGNKDPFALRRAALGAVRLLIEKDFDIPLDRLLAIAANAFDSAVQVTPEALLDLRGFILDRLRNHYREQGISTRQVNAVLAAPVGSLPDLDARLQALNTFMDLPAAESLVAANKRIGNILRKSGEEVGDVFDEKRVVIAEEKRLFDEVSRLEVALEPLFTNAEYTPALAELANLQETVDAFFDHVMVMDEDLTVRANRLALLARLKGLFDRVADLSMAA